MEFIRYQYSDKNYPAAGAMKALLEVAPLFKRGNCRAALTWRESVTARRKKLQYSAEYPITAFILVAASNFIISDPYPVPVSFTRSQLERLS